MLLKNQLRAALNINKKTRRLISAAQSAIHYPSEIPSKQLSRHRDKKLNSTTQTHRVRATPPLLIYIFSKKKRERQKNNVYHQRRDSAAAAALAAHVIPQSSLWSLTPAAQAARYTIGSRGSNTHTHESRVIKSSISGRAHSRAVSRSPRARELLGYLSLSPSARRHELLSSARARDRRTSTSGEVAEKHSSSGRLIAMNPSARAHAPGRLSDRDKGVERCSLIKVTPAAGRVVGVCICTRVAR